MGWFSGSLVRLKPTTGYGVVRCALAVILLVAAGLKCHQLATEPTLSTGFLESRWFLMATVEIGLFSDFFSSIRILVEPAFGLIL